MLRGLAMCLSYVELVRPLLLPLAQLRVGGESTLEHLPVPCPLHRTLSLGVYYDKLSGGLGPRGRPPHAPRL